MYKFIKQKIYGISLVSLLISITLGAFLIVIMLQIFNATRSTYQLSQNLSEMNQILRYVAVVVDGVVGGAGYTNINPVTNSLDNTIFTPFGQSLTGPTGGTYDSTQPNADDPSGVVLSYFPGEDVIINANGTFDDGLWVKYAGDSAGRIRGCNGAYGVTTTAVMSRFYSRSVDSTNAATTAYYCEDQTAGESEVYTDGTVTGTELIPPELFVQAWVTYGEDLTGKGFIDRWSLGPDVQNRNQVYAVRFAFLIHSRDKVRTTAQTTTFNIFDQTVSFTDQYIYRLQMFTVLTPFAPNYPLAALLATP